MSEGARVLGSAALYDLRKEADLVGHLDGRVCIVTGAGRGIGRAHALLLAQEGARVVVNDVGSDPEGRGRDPGPANLVVEEIHSLGGEAVANTESVADWEGPRAMVDSAIRAFGDLHVVVNNAGILRNRLVVQMTEEELDAVVNVHIKGPFAMARWAGEYWRQRSKFGYPVAASIINTASGAMLGTPNLSNYTAAKAGIAAATITMAMELERYGVRVNCIAPLSRSRLAPAADDIAAMLKEPDDPDAFDLQSPANIAPLVGYLAAADCPVTGGVFHVGGNEVGLYRGWLLRDEDVLVKDGRWTVGELIAAGPQLLEGRGPLASQATTLEETYLGRRPVTISAPRP